MTLRTTNLNLLPVLRAVLKEASITRAAATLGLSQPAASNALRRLRDLLGDPLLVQTGRTMRLTPRAETLRPAVETVCCAIGALLLDAAFVPAQARRDFVVATPDYMALLLAPPLMRRLAETAPGISVRFTDIGSDFRQHLASGHADIAIIASVEDAVRGFHTQSGYVDRLVGVVAADHPLACDPPRTSEEMLAYPRLGIDAIPQGLRAPSHLAGLVASGNGPLRISVSHLLTLPFLPGPGPLVGPVGQAVERGQGYTAYAEQSDSLCGMEVVLADGTVLRTGMGGVDGSTAWQAFKYVGAMGEGLSPYPFLLTYPQDLHERLLIGKLADQGVTVERSTRLLGFEQDERGVRVRVQGPHGTEDVAADYLAGCYGGVRAGQRLPWVATADNFAPLASLEWQAHVYGVPAAGLAEACAGLGVPLHAFPSDRAIRRAGLGRNALYLVRPDGHVALAEPRGTAECIRTYLARHGLRPEVASTAGQS